MSHIVTIETQIRDPIAIAAACRRLGWTKPSGGKAKLFSGQAQGVIVHAPDWRYPIVCATQTGTLHYDNYEGCWGDPARLDAFLQAYAVEKAKIEAHKHGHTVMERSLPNGAVKLTVHVASEGGAV